MPHPDQRPVADWVAVHGNAAISDSTYSVEIAHYAGEAVVSPALDREHWSTGIVHFPLCSAPNGSTKPIKLLATFETAMALIQRVELYYGGSEIYQRTLTEDDTLECLNISSISAYGVEAGRCGHGINVAIAIRFFEKNSQVSFRSIGMVYSK